METRRLVVQLAIGLGLFSLLCLSSTRGDDIDVSDVPAISSSTSLDISKPSLRRRIMRKRIINNGDSNQTNVSLSIKVSKSEDEHIVEELPKPEALFEDAAHRFRRPLLGNKFRPPFLNRTRSVTSAPQQFLQRSTGEPLETPSSSFKLKLKSRIPFTKYYPTTTTEEPPTTFKALLTRKPFPVKKLLKRLKSKTLTTTTTTVEPSGSDEESEEDTTDEIDAPISKPFLEKPSSTSTTTTTTTTSTTTQATTTSTTTELTSTTPSTTAFTSTVPMTSTTIASTESSLQHHHHTNSSMIIIPVPPSQRKPYHPVIMQVTKTPTTAESLPETRVVTYKLNKMFIPMGIYGKVLGKTAGPKELDVATEKTIVSTPLPFVLPGQDKDKPTYSPMFKTKGPEIKVKGHRSKEVADSIGSGDASSDYARAVQYAESQKDHHLKQQRQWEAMMEKLKKKQRNMADSISLTYDYKPNPAQISLTTQKVNVDQISLTTESPMQTFSEDNRRGQQHPSWGGLHNGFHEMTPPRPLKQSNQKPTKGIFETLTNAASSIPGLIHEGLSTLSGYGQAFEDEAAFPRTTESSVPPRQQQTLQKLQQQQHQPPPELDSETLEFFRKRPHLLKNRGKKDSFVSPEYSSGFKPVTAPPHFASQYYASTPKTTTPSSSTYYKTTTVGYTPNSTASHDSILRRDPLFESSSTWNHIQQHTTSRTAKNFLSDDDIAAYRATALRSSSNYDGSRARYIGHAQESSSALSPTQKSFASQWIEFNNKYSKNEIEEARKRVSSLFSKSSDPTYEEMMYMKPPSPKSGNAFDDLLKMFKMGFSFGAGHTSNDQPMVSYSAGMHKEETQAQSNSDWVPLTKAGGNKIISFNAGITFGNKPKPTPIYSGQFGTHFSSSSKPYIPSTSKYQEHFNKGNSHYSGSLNNHGGSSHYSSPMTKGNYYSHSSSTKDTHSPVTASPTAEFLTNIYYNSKKPSQSNYDISQAISTHFDPVDGRKPFSYFDMSPDAIRMAMKNPSNSYSHDPAIEIIPSSQFFKEQGNMKDIAAVIKPPELSDDMVKAALPPQIASIPQLSYPTQQLIQNPNNFKSLSQLQQYFATAQPQPTLSSLNQKYQLQKQQPQHQKQQQQVHQHQPHQENQYQQQQVHQHQPHQEHQYQQQQVHQHQQHQEHQYQQVQAPQHTPKQTQQQYQQQEVPQHQLQQTQQYQQQEVPQHQPEQTQQYHQQQLYPLQLQQPQPLQQNSQQEQQHQSYPQPHLQHQHQDHQNFHQSTPNLPQLQHQPHNQPQQTPRVKVSGDSGIGFSNFELPPGLDPDIASLIKSELDKDDIPEEFRKDFLEAQDKEKQQQQSGSRLRGIVTKPDQSVSKRIDKKPDVKFHKPIPITPTMLTPLRGKPIRASPVPRYVVELARKLKEDKNVQGIVRVSTKRDKGPPIEYLYPVRG